MCDSSLEDPFKLEELPWHILDDIFARLEIRDLLKVGLVCKSWNSAVSQEISRRGPTPERALIPHTFGDRYKYPDPQVLNIFNMTHLSILFIGPCSTDRSLKNAERNILKRYSQHFDKNVIAVGVVNCFEDITHIKSCPGVLGRPDGILGLFLPKWCTLKIKIAYIATGNDYVSFFPKLLPDNRAEKSTFLIFARPSSGVDGLWLKIKQNLTPKTYALWGGTFDEDLRFMAPLDETRGGNRPIHKAQILGVNIYGSKMQSWSIVIDCKIREDELHERLLRFRDVLELKRKTIGLACGPTYMYRDDSTGVNYHVERYAIMNAIWKIFPGIPFIGAFNDGEHGHFGVDSTSDDPNQEFSTPWSVSLLVMTFD